MARSGGQRNDAVYRRDMAQWGIPRDVPSPGVMEICTSGQHLVEFGLDLGGESGDPGASRVDVGLHVAQFTW